jgi:hypothetical protein
MKGGVIEKIHRLSFDLRIFRHFDHRTIIRTYYSIPQSTDSNHREGYSGIRHQDPKNSELWESQRQAYLDPFQPKNDTYFPLTFKKTTFSIPP